MGIIRYLKDRVRVSKRKKDLKKAGAKLLSRSSRMKVFEARTSAIFNRFLLRKKKGMREVASPRFRGRVKGLDNYYPSGLSVKRVNIPGRKTSYRAMHSPQYGFHEAGHAYFLALHDHLKMRVNPQSPLAELEDSLCYPYTQLGSFGETAKRFPSQESFAKSILRLYRSKRMRPILDELSKKETASTEHAKRVKTFLASIEAFLKRESARYAGSGQ